MNCLLCVVCCADVQLYGVRHDGSVKADTVHRVFGSGSVANSTISDAIVRMSSLVVLQAQSGALWQ